MLGREPAGQGVSSRLWAVTALLSCVPSLHQLQFVLTIIQTSCGVIWPCTFPLGWLYFQIGYMISLIALFTNFYIQVNLLLLWQLGFWNFSAKAPSLPLRGMCGAPVVCWALGSNSVTGRPCFQEGAGLLPAEEMLRLS